MGAISNWLAEVFDDLAQRIDLPIISATCSSIAGICEAVGAGADKLGERVANFTGFSSFGSTFGNSAQEQQGYVPPSMYAAEQASTVSRDGIGIAIEPPAPVSMENLLPQHALSSVDAISSQLAFNVNMPSFDSLNMGIEHLNALSPMQTPNLRSASMGMGMA